MAVVTYPLKVDKPVHPLMGETYYDIIRQCAYTWTGIQWIMIAPELRTDNTNYEPGAPTKEEAEKYPALQEAWEAYMIVRKLVGKA
jgi:hypothetical protein